MPPNSSHWRNADRMAKGRLGAIILGYRADGCSLTEITKRLWAEHQIEASVATVGNWVNILAAEAASGKAS